MSIWHSLLILPGAAIAAITSLQNVVHEHRSGSLRPKLLFWIVPGWTSERRASPFIYWIGIALDWFQVIFFTLLTLVTAAYVLQGFAAS